MEQTEFSSNKIFSRFALNRLSILPLHYPAIVIAIIAIITILFGWHLPKLQFRTTIDDLVVADLPATARYNAFRSQFGSDEIIRVVVRTRNVFDAKTFDQLTQFSQAVEKIDGIRRLISLPLIKKTVDLADNWSLEKFAATIAPVALFEKDLLSTDRKATVMTLILKNDADKEHIIESVEALIDRAPKDLTVYQIGMPLVSQAMARYTEKDFKRLPLITLLLITLILLILFRSKTGLIPPLASIIVTLIWTFGLMGWMRVPLSMMTMIVPIFLIAVGTAYTMHITAAYMVRIHRADSHRRAVAATLADTTLPSILAVATTTVGLSSLWVTQIMAIREFALFTIFGMGCLLVVLLLLFPALLVIIPPPPLNKRDLFRRWIHSFLERIIATTLKHRRFMLVITGAATIICLAGLGLIRVETNPMSFFKKTTPISGHFHDIYQDLSGSFPVHVVLTADRNDYFENPLNINHLIQLQQYLETLPGVDKAISFADYVKLVNYSSNQYDPADYVVPQKAFEMRFIINSYKSLLGKDMLDRFMDNRFSKTNILLYTHLSSSSEFLRLQQTITAYAKSNLPDELTVDTTGFGMVVAASSHLLTTSQIKSLGIALVAIFLIMWLLFLSGKVGLTALVPNVFPIIVNFGVMGWMGIPLSMETSLIAGIAIGLAVDDTIYYLFRYNREFKKDLDKDRALSDTIRHIGRPIVFTTLAIGIGFSILMFSHFKPTAIFGLLMVITMLAALVADLIILPALMLHVELVTAWDLLKLMPALSGISADTAHELNQPLNVIKMGGDYLKMMLKQKKKIGEDDLIQISEEICRQVDRATDIVQRLTASGEQPGFVREKVNLNESIVNALDTVNNHLRVENITVDFLKDETLPQVMANATRVGEVLNHLLINARDAIVADSQKNSGKITVRTFQSKDSVVITIADTGVGIPSHIRDRIFEPFFTTKASGKGKGLGLTICRQIVKGFGGHLDISSKKENGTIVKLTFPIHIATEMV